MSETKGWTADSVEGVAAFAKVSHPVHIPGGTPLEFPLIGQEVEFRGLFTEEETGIKFTKYGSGKVEYANITYTTKHPKSPLKTRIHVVNEEGYSRPLFKDSSGWVTYDVFNRGRK